MGLELALARSLASRPWAEKLRDAALKRLPTASRPLEMADAIAHIQELMKSPLHAFASRPAQGMVTEILAVLRSVARGYPPCFTSWGGDTVLKKVRDEVYLKANMTFRNFEEPSGNFVNLLLDS